MSLYHGVNTQEELLYYNDKRKQVHIVVLIQYYNTIIEIIHHSGLELTVQLVPDHFSVCK